MSGVTGIELGPNYCVLIKPGRGGHAGSQRTVSTASTLLLSAWSGDRKSRVQRLREARESGDFPSRARVVAWGSGSATAPNDIAALASLAEAGFEIGLVLSPSQALGRMVRARSTIVPNGTAVAALSLNNHGAAIAIVAGAEVICSRVFEWPLGQPFVDARSALLDRYLLVSQLAPQLQHLIDLVRPVNGVTVTSVLVSGNLPDLRSLVMLLIEEMDFEVETLDSAELLEAGASAFGDSVASLRLAASVASAGETRVPVYAQSDLAADVEAAAEEPRAKPVWRWIRLQSLAALVVLVFSSAWSLTQVVSSSPALRIFPAGIEQAQVAEVKPAGATSEPPLPALELAEPAVEVEATTGRAQNIMHRAAIGRRPVAVRDRPPLPAVDGIMIAGPRRLAIVDGTVVAAGDAVGVRAIARIERDGVVLREPSGREIYVAVRPRKPPPPGS
jgi:hypothetical protein